MRRLAVFALVAGASFAGAQTRASKQPESVSGCETALNALRLTARASTAAEFARRCADHVVSLGVRAVDVPDLADLYDAAQDRDRAAAYRILHELGVPITSARYPAHWVADAAPDRAAHTRSEALAARLDSLPASVNDLKLLAHQLLLTESKTLLDHASTAGHAERVIELATKARPRTVAVEAASSTAFADLAQTLGDSGQVDETIRVLARAQRDLSHAAYRSAGLASMRDRYALIGRPAPAIDAPHWINAAAQHGPRVLAHDRVTVIQFTGVSCAPCRASYPSLVALYNRLDRSQLDMVFVTALTGTFDGKKTKPLDELAATSDYYAKKNGIPFPVAIQNAPPTIDVTSKRYAALGIPQFVVVDKKGVIRRITIGWDSTSAQPLEALVGTLIAERR